MRPPRNIPGLIFGLVLSLSVPAFAVVEEDEIVNTYERELTSEEMAADLGRQAEDRRKIEGVRKVHYGEILDSPNNLELNFLFARQQLLTGDILGASATLERILMIDPTLAPVRLYYGISLFRLGDLPEAERELAILTKEDIPDDIRKQVDGYLSQIRKQRKTTRFLLRQTAGYGYDHNRNAASHAGVSFTNDTAIPLTGAGLRHSDTNLNLVSHLRAEQDLGSQEGHYAFGSFTYYQQEQTKLDNLDLQSFGGTAGVTYKSGLANFTPAFTIGHLFLSRQTFLRTQAASLTADRNFGNRWSGQTFVQFQRQDYQNVTVSPTSEEREGPQLDLGISAGYLLTPTMKVSPSLGFRNKHAAQKFNRYQELIMQLSHLWLPGKGQYVVNSIESNFDYYKKANSAVQATRRRDYSIRYRFTYGAPLTFLQIGKILPKHLKDINASFTYEYYRNVSTISSNTYRNYKFQFTLSKTLEF